MKNTSAIPARHRRPRFSLKWCLLFLAAGIYLGYSWPRPVLSPVDTLIHNQRECRALHGVSQAEIEKRLGPPDNVAAGGTEWWYSQDDVSGLWPMSLSKSLVLHFENGKVTDAYSRD